MNESCTVASLACRHAQGDGDMGFAATAGAKSDDLLASIDKIRAGQIHNQFLVECGDRIEVETLQALDGREPRRLDASLNHAGFAVYQLQFDQARQVPGMIGILRRTLPSQLLILPVYRTRFLGHKFVSCGGPE